MSVLRSMADVVNKSDPTTVSTYSWGSSFALLCAVFAFAIVEFLAVSAYAWGLVKLSRPLTRPLSATPDNVPVLVYSKDSGLDKHTSQIHPPRWPGSEPVTSNRQPTAWALPVTTYRHHDAVHIHQNQNQTPFQHRFSEDSSRKSTDNLLPQTTASRGTSPLSATGYRPPALRNSGHSKQTSIISQYASLDTTSPLEPAPSTQIQAPQVSPETQLQHPPPPGAGSKFEPESLSHAESLARAFVARHMSQFTVDLSRADSDSSLRSGDESQDKWTEPGTAPKSAWKRSGHYGSVAVPGLESSPTQITYPQGGAQPQRESSVRSRHSPNRDKLMDEFVEAYGFVPGS
ncbi:uncharacterized protein BJ171DRAFT_474648 [Polychytrium aggregatum]|uniref:uncharacterized protein n=1 Tax=Polychytrium aggregatum TaxID=110093 RepID=UPI0022FE7A92|nr:uncharacterized protein BJ171DRAFT_474648 [Polychytrium aggregatum]KAI9204798.1 hypothetical protein BJ171DRAFT_474648 [Polychytrium aggregatum]